MPKAYYNLYAVREAGNGFLGWSSADFEEVCSWNACSQLCRRRGNGLITDNPFFYKKAWMAFQKFRKYYIKLQDETSIPMLTTFHTIFREALNNLKTIYWKLLAWKYFWGIRMLKKHSWWPSPVGLEGKVFCRMTERLTKRSPTVLEQYSSLLLLN